MMIPATWLETSRERLSPLVKKTPLIKDESHKFWLKLENRQITGSFKIRGALNKVLSLEEWEIQRGLVAASAGNHGQGVAFAARQVNAQVTVFVSESAVASKIEKMKSLGAEVVLVRGGYGLAESMALEYASSHNSTWISPYNDGQVISGQATVAFEIMQQFSAWNEAEWIVPVGGGGLISGIGAAISDEASRNGIDISKLSLIGVQSEASPFMHHLFHANTQSGVTELPSLADGLSGPVETGSLTIPLIKKFVNDIVLMSESQIIQAIKFAWDEYQEQIEGSAATCLAVALQRRKTSSNVILIISGGNIQPEIHQKLVSKQGFNG